VTNTLTALCYNCKGSGRHPSEFECLACKGTGRIIDPGVKHIKVSFVEQDAQAYETLDDWRQVGDRLEFIITDTGNPVYNQMLLIHAMVERLLARNAGVSDETINAFDLEYKGNGEPGEEPDAPYRDAHLTAKAIEMTLSAQMGISWKEYEEAIGALIVEKPKSNSHFIKGEPKTREESIRTFKQQKPD